MGSATEALLGARGAVRRRDACEWGLSLKTFDGLVSRGLLVQVVRGVFLRPAEVDDVAARAGAVALTLPAGAAVCRRTAAWLWGIDARGPSERDQVLDVECCVPVGSAVVRSAGVRGFVTDLLPEDVDLTHGVPCTTTDRTAVDLARWLAPHMGLACLDAMAGRGLVDPDHLADLVERWRGARYVDRARRLISLCEPLTESYGESWLRLRVVDAGFPRPEVQVWIFDENGVALYRLDMGWPDRRIGLEYDGEEFHSSTEDRRHDEERRDDLARRFSWDVLGVGRGEVLGRSLALELGVGEMLGMQPKIARRTW